MVAVAPGAGGDAGAGGAGGVPLRVVETFPVDGASDVARDVVVSAELDMVVDAMSVNNESLTVRRGGDSEIEGGVAVSSQTVTWTPTTELALLGSYTATLMPTVMSTDGVGLAEAVSWSFRVRDGHWGTAELIETDNAGDAFEPQVAIDPDGNALAVWEQFDGTRDSIWANRFTAATGWGTAERIETDDAGNATAPRVAIDAEGNALAVWEQSDGARDNIWANRFTPETGWGTAELLETDNEGAGAPEVAVSPDGNALAVWAQFDGTQFSIWSNRFE